MSSFKLQQIEIYQLIQVLLNKKFKHAFSIDRNTSASSSCCSGNRFGYERKSKPPFCFPKDTSLNHSCHQHLNSPMTNHRHDGAFLVPNRQNRLHRGSLRSSPMISQSSRSCCKINPTHIYISRYPFEKPQFPK